VAHYSRLCSLAVPAITTVGIVQFIDIQGDIASFRLLAQALLSAG